MTTQSNLLKSIQNLGSTRQSGNGYGCDKMTSEREQIGVEAKVVRHLERLFLGCC